MLFQKSPVHCILALTILPWFFVESRAATTAMPATGVINDAWYTVQVGSVPWATYHEIIEKKENRYFYRYAMTKVEKGTVYLENIGAMADADLGPLTYNIVKAGSGTTEIIDASYTADKYGGVFKINIKGTKNARYERRVSKDTILDVFFPVWLSRNWAKLKPGYRTVVSSFAEDNESGDFHAQTLKLEVQQDTSLGCLGIKVEFNSVRALWCMNAGGILIDLKMGGVHVRKVAGESEAKSFLSGVLPKK